MSEKINPPLVINAALEALLFVSVEPVEISQLAVVLEVSPEEVIRGLDELSAALSTRGLRLQQHAGRVQLTTAPEAAELVEHLLGLESTTHLSRAAIESLAIIAYQQPVTRPQVDSVRGVNSDGVMRSLLGKGLIQEIGRGEGPGRPILYGTTTEFLEHFGLVSLGELPALDLSMTELGNHDNTVLINHDETRKD